MPTVQLIDNLSVQQNMPEVGVYAAFYLSNSSARKLYTWCRSKQIPFPEKIEELHITTVYSKKPIPYEGFGKLTVPYRLDPKGYKWKMLGPQQEALVLTVQGDILLDAWTKSQALGAQWDYPSYQPHITVSNNAQYFLERQLTKFPVPDFALYLSEERVTPLEV